MNIIEAIDDPNLLGASIRDPGSWKPWRALLGAAFGLPLDPYQAELFRQCTGRRVPPGAPAAYLWLCIGRRGGSAILSRAWETTLAAATAFPKASGN